MTQPGLSEIRNALQSCFTQQREAVAAWHDNEPEEIELDGEEVSLERLASLIARENLRNFRLWHVEDQARRKDVDATVIASCKQQVDALNQSRNDYMEKTDACLVSLLLPLLPKDAAERYNTESLGAAIDRLSILCLKIFHMQEQTERMDVDADHIAKCQQKLAVLNEQHGDLCRAVDELVEEYADGRKRPKVYYQFKMYNDPSLNPALYKAGQTVSK